MINNSDRNVKTWAGGGAGLWPALPAATVRLMAPQATGVSNTRYNLKKLTIIATADIMSDLVYILV